MASCPVTVTAASIEITQFSITPETVEQGEDFTMAPMLSKEMAKIDWENKTAEEIKNLVRGLNPIMGAVTHSGNKTIKIWKT